MSRLRLCRDLLSRLMIMAITLGSNIASLKAQRSLAESSSKLSTVFERLSSGLRINSAQDDAAGLLLAENLSSRSRLMDRALRNVADMGSLLNVADGALEQLNNVVVRQQELAQQAANGVYTFEQRQSLHEEAQALNAEYNRIVSASEFNGRKVLSDTNTVSLSIGGGESIAFALNEELARSVGTGSFTYAASYSVTGGRRPEDVQIGDFNNDGIVDAALALPSFDDVGVLLGNADGTFKAIHIVTNTGDARNLELGDLNGDGYLDIVSAGYSTSNVDVILGNGDGTFYRADSLSPAGNLYDVEVNDLDQDGNLDIVASDHTNRSLQIFYGTGSGSFSSPTSLALAFGSAPRGIESGDFDRDGNIDLVVGTTGTFDFSIHYGTDAGGFEDAVTFASQSGATDIEVADLDNDGYLDLISGVSVLGVAINQGGRNYDVTTYSDYTFVRGINANDLNGDGVPDLLVVDDSTDLLSVLLGNPDGSFAAPDTIDLGAGANPEDAAAADLNGDGALDILTLDFTNGTMLVYFGQTTATSEQARFSLLSEADARQALEQLDTDRSRVVAQRSAIGAQQQRLQFTEDSLLVARENYESAASRIRDADIAREAAELTRLSILQQASTSILAQANVQQSPVLALLS